MERFSGTVLFCVYLTEIFKSSIIINVLKLCTYTLIYIHEHKVHIYIELFCHRVLCRKLSGLIRKVASTVRLVAVQHHRPHLTAAAVRTESTQQLVHHRHLRLHRHRRHQWQHHLVIESAHRQWIRNLLCLDMLNIDALKASATLKLLLPHRYNAYESTTRISRRIIQLIRGIHLSLSKIMNHFEIFYTDSWSQIKVENSSHLTIHECYET